MSYTKPMTAEQIASSLGQLTQSEREELSTGSCAVVKTNGASFFWQRRAEREISEAITQATAAQAARIAELEFKLSKYEYASDEGQAVHLAAVMDALKLKPGEAGQAVERISELERELDSLRLSSDPEDSRYWGISNREADEIADKMLTEQTVAEATSVLLKQNAALEQRNAALVEAMKEVKQKSVKFACDAPITKYFDMFQELIMTASDTLSLSTPSPLDAEPVRRVLEMMTLISEQCKKNTGRPLWMN